MGEQLGSFSSPRAYLRVNENGLFYIRSHFHDVWGELRLFRLFRSPKAYIKGESYIGRLAPRFTQCFALLSLKSNTWGEAQNFSKSQSLYGGRARNFSQSQVIYTERKLGILSSLGANMGSARSSIDIFLHIFDIFLHISYIFLHIFDIFLHIPEPI